ncbi:MAG: gamma-glutamylcyclotransferase [Desulfomonilaceae bacterium]|nr:gamma-glutamylcyclotransferase [Desulfomonilaceae bacterium]
MPPQPDGNRRLNEGRFGAAVNSAFGGGKAIEVEQQLMIVLINRLVLTIRLGAVLLSFVSLMLPGCFTAPREAHKTVDSPHVADTRAEERLKKSIVRPNADEKAPAGSDETSVTDIASRTDHGREAKKTVSTHEFPSGHRLIDNRRGLSASRADSLKPHKARSEDDYVRSVALKLANEHSGIGKIKICYDSQGEEWWILLYQDAGAFYDLKQYVWNIYLDDPEPFLVVERVSRRGLGNHLYGKEPHRKCEVFEPGTAGPITAQAGPDVRVPTKELTTEARVPTRGTDRRPMTVPGPAHPRPGNPDVPGSRSPRLKASTTTSGPRESRITAQGRRGSPDTEAGSHRAKISSGDVRGKKPREASASKVSGRPRTSEEGFVTTEVGMLRSHSPDSERTRQRLSAHAGDRARMHVRVDASRSSVSLGRQPPEADRHPSLSQTPRDGSRHSNEEQPTFRTASAGAGAGTYFGVHGSRDSPITRSRGSSSMTVRPDQSEGPGLAALDNRSRSRAGAPTYFVFAYGSKMNHPELLEWLDVHGYDSSLIVSATPGILEGYDYVWNFYSPSRGGGAVNLERKKNSRVWGLLIEFEDPLLQAFDRREGHPFAYTRGHKRVAVTRAPDGEKVFAWLYLANVPANARRDILPTPEYKRMIVQAARFWGFPEDYVSRLKSWETR